MGDVTVLEAAHDMGDGVHFANVGQELVAQPLALGRAPRTRPAISTNVSRVGMIWPDLAMPASLSRRGSGTATSPTFGSMVQNG
jgi:hypothetical protein